MILTMKFAKIAIETEMGQVSSYGNITLGRCPPTLTIQIANQYDFVHLVIIFESIGDIERTGVTANFVVALYQVSSQRNNNRHSCNIANVTIKQQ